MTWESQQGSFRSLSNSSLYPLYILGPQFFQNKFTLLVVSIKIYDLSLAQCLPRNC